jgi:membrane protein DedA with SNARE-associated domain
LHVASGLDSADAVLASLNDTVAGFDGTEKLLVYLAIVMLVAAEAIMPFLPGETTVVTGATLAADGSLAVVGVFVAGWLGALLGDLLLYGIGRLGSDRIQAWVGRAIGEDRLESGRYFMGRYGQPFLVLGRFVPGLRVVTALTAGTVELPVRRYLPAELLGSGLWALYATWLGYTVGSKLEGQPWLSIVVALAATAIISTVVGFLYRRAGRRRAAAET